MLQTNTLGNLLAVDIGNTNITCGIYSPTELLWTARLASDTRRTADEYYSLLAPLLKDAGLQSLEAVALASVVPELTRIWEHLLSKYSSAEVYEITALSDLGLTYKVDEPARVGADLVANAFAAWKKYASHCIVIDLGTATTVQLVSAGGCYEGVVIAPGLRTGAEQLFEKAALLTPIEICAPEVLLGNNTRNAMLSGIVHGHAFMLENMIQKLKRQYFDYKDILTVATGGIADLVKPIVPSIDVLDKTLTLDGIWLAHGHLTAR